MSKLALSARNVEITYRTYLDPPQGLRARLKSRASTRRYRDIGGSRRLV